MCCLTLIDFTRYMILNYVHGLSRMYVLHDFVMWMSNYINRLNMVNSYVFLKIKVSF